MNKNELKKYIGMESISLIEAMQLIDQNSAGLIYIIDEKGRLTGCLTDGDVRRWIIKNGRIDGTVQQAMNRNPKYVYGEDIERSRKKMEEEQISSIVVLNNERNIEDILFHGLHPETGEDRVCKVLRHTPVIVMAGGKGTRLYPYTKILPKPLIPVGEVPILERILSRFHRYGVNEFFLTVNYKKEMIKAYFREAQSSYVIHYIEESQPLGTAGSIRMIDRKFKQPVIVTNCDILIRTDYEEMVKYHNSSGNDLTIVSSLKNVSIPYGVIHSKEQGIIVSMEEKPNLSVLVNTGMYIINPEFLNWIPKNRIFHMTDLVQMLMKENRQVGMYPISGNAFLDMGEFEEMKRMEEQINSGYVY